MGENGGAITEAHATGAVSGSTYVGGLVGFDINDGTITKAYATGAVHGASGSIYVGGLVGYNDAQDFDGASITDAYATGAVSGGSNVGGLVGYNDAQNSNGAFITDAHATGAVSGDSNVGGLVGESHAGTIQDAYATGAVSGGSGGNVGGLVGYSFSTITDSHATGVVSGDSNVGGLVGYNDAGGSITYAYATGAVSGSSKVGGLVGYNYDRASTITDSYATGAVSGGSGSAEVGGLVGRNGGTITDAYATGAVSGDSGSTYVGGLVGFNRLFSTITDAYATGVVSGRLGSMYVGGLVGTNDGTITDAYATGAASGSDRFGGLVGYNAGKVINGYWDTTTGNSAGIGINSGQLTGGGAETTAGLASALVLSALNSGGAAWANANNQTTPYLAAIPGPVYLVSDSTTLYQTIANVDQLQAINNNLSDNYVLINNIDASSTANWNSGAGFVPIGGNGSSNGQYTGTFDGLGHVISGLTIHRPATNYIGLFGLVSSGGIVRNVGLDGGSVSGRQGVGGLVGGNTGTIQDAYATGAVSGSQFVGGLVGYNDAGGSITDAYATGAVNGSQFVGGLVGYNLGSSSIAYAYATGAVNGSGTVGGLVGANGSDPGRITFSYWDTDTTGQQTYGCFADATCGGGATGLTMAAFQSGAAAGLGSAFGGGATGLYPYLTVFYPNGVEAVSGFAYEDAGVTPAASGAAGAVTVGLDSGGTLLAQATTGHNGYYYIAVPAGTFSTGSRLSVYTAQSNLSGAADAATYTDAANTTTTPNTSGVDIYGGWQRDLPASGVTTLSGLDATDAAAATGTPVTALTLANREIDTAAANFSLDQSITLTGTLRLDGSATITQTSGTIAANSLLLTGGADFTLASAGNAFGALAASGGAISVTDGASLAIRGLAGVSGVTGSGAVMLVSGGDLTIASGAPVTAGSGFNVALAASGNFINQAGSTAVSVSAGGRWLVYSSGSASDSFDSLDSGNTAIWNATLAGLPPANVTAGGNRYLFAEQPVLTVTTTDVDKTYGGDATSLVAAAYAVSGYRSGVTGAFLADDQSSVYSGTPSVTSSGSVPTATVASSPYQITATTGSLIALNGYAFTFVNAGTLTVTASSSNANRNTYSSGQYEPSGNGNSGSGNTSSTNVIFQNANNTNTPVITTVSQAGSNTNQNIATGSGPNALFTPFSLFDSSQYTNATLPSVAPQAEEAAVLTMIARAEENNRNAPKIGALWQGNTARWPSDDKALKNVSFSDGHGHTRTPNGNNGFPFKDGTTDIASLLQHGPVMLGGAASGGQPTPWLLALKTTADGKGIIANDPLTGGQVILAYDPTTKTVGGVTAVIDPKTHKPVPLGTGAPTLAGHKTKVPDAVWPELKGFTPTSYFAVSI